MLCGRLQKSSTKPSVQPAFSRKRAATCSKTQLGLALQQRSQALAAMPDPSTHHAQTDRNKLRGFQNQTAEAAMSLAVLS